MPKILWIDNDAGYTWAPAAALSADGITVDRATTVSDGERLLAANNYDVIILDVMIPVTPDEEESLYPPQLTDNAHATGLLFYHRHASVINATGAQVIILTVRIDDVVRNDFLAAGLPIAAFRTKLEMRHTPKFVEFIRSTIARAAGGAL